MARSRRSRGSIFKATIIIDKNGYGRISVPPHVIEKEDLRGRDRAEFEVKSIEE